MKLYHNREDNTVYTEREVIRRENGWITRNYRKMTQLEVNQYLKKVNR